MLTTVVYFDAPSVFIIHFIINYCVRGELHRRFTELDYCVRSCARLVAGNILTIDIGKRVPLSIAIFWDELGQFRRV